MTSRRAEEPAVTVEVGRRVRVTSPRTAHAHRRPRRTSASDIDELTRLGEVYVQSLMRAQLRLAGYVVLLLAGTLGLLPLLLRVDAVADARLLGLPLPWLVLGVGVYPWLIGLACWYVRRSERNEAAFDDLVEGSR